MLCSVLRPVVGGAEKLRNVLALSDASTKLLRFTSDDVWGSKGVCRVISRSTSAYLVQAWDHHHHHQITRSSHSINAIGPAPHRGGRNREHRSIVFATITSSAQCAVERSVPALQFFWLNGV
jgi:hypothetical protein